MNDSLASKPAVEGKDTYQEIRWPLGHLTLAGLHWPCEKPQPEAPPVVMLHGWLDNCLSFVRLAPELRSFADVYALDMAGHGHSGHRPQGQSYLLVDYVADLAEMVDASFSRPVDLVGHSLGGIVALLYAAAFPEKVRKLVLIDSFGPISKTADEAVAQLRRGIIKRISGSGSSGGYATRKEAGRARAGGLSPLSPEAAEQLVGRNLRQAGDAFVWRTDPRLRHPSLTMYTEDQTQAFIRSVKADTLLIRAEKGLLGNPAHWQSRMEAMPSLKEVVVPGSHHCHLDGDTRPVADAVRGFLINEH
ncbi:alpha/beta fold hydrolase [Marinobacter sp.]|uniref:alpha/beta fold hydrolase n=1 Tax=Marinobacter sp. TaxID=50741 RepID=UPI0038500E9B